MLRNVQLLPDIVGQATVLRLRAGHRSLTPLEEISPNTMPTAEHDLPLDNHSMGGSYWLHIPIYGLGRAQRTWPLLVVGKNIRLTTTLTAHRILAAASGA
jgi:hypothetical protein